MTRSPKQARQSGFTIIELLVVISIMAVIATLATGAALKSIQQSRKKRVNITAKALEAALVNYRALKDEWPYPFKASAGTMDPVCDKYKKTAGFARTVTFGKYSHDEHGCGEKRKGRYEASENHRVFKEVFEEVKKGRALIDTSSILTRVKDGGRMTVREALERNKTEIPVGYLNPENQNEFIFFKVQYNFDTDSISVGKDE